MAFWNLFLIFVLQVFCYGSARSVAPLLACQNGTAGRMSDCPRDFKCVFPAGVDPQTGLFYGLCELEASISCQADVECPSPARCSNGPKVCII
ncbi:unnamed protein product [Bursaphelenchus xylophilus]|uniref:(pine wood nematode) hypothetical protein n=1 Tax=Bursaphelenchus xylophilus TaxID=6326 RepID=A0A1I7RXJ5_BURXY|nr:unnamed protein product [Bursaphelenchus xylophilus]CAG9126486.1 unnamed protein product [Bursaphelenchus xylophilus]